MLGGAHDTMGMGYGVLTPVLKPKIFFGLAGREREKLTRRLEIRGSGEGWASAPLRAV